MVPQAGGYAPDAVTVATNVVLVVVIGGVLALLSRNARRAEAQLARERANDAAALRMAERVRSSLTLADVLEAAVAEIGQAVRASRCVIRLAPQPDGSMPLYQWFAPGMPRISFATPPAPAMRVFETAEPLVVEDVRQADDETREFASAVHIRSLLVQPVTWHGRVVAIVSVGDTRPRDWRDDALALLARVVPQLGAALAQAQLFEQQQEALERLQEVTRLREELVATSRTSCAPRSRRRSASSRRSSARTSSSTRTSESGSSPSPARRPSGSPCWSTICSSSRAWSAARFR